MITKEASRIFSIRHPGKAVPFQNDDFIGEVKNDKGCNVMIINQNIHSTGTHTECAGHILEKDIYIP